MKHHPEQFAPVLGSPFNYVTPEKLSVAIDNGNYAPRPAPAFDMSPQSTTSSTSSDGTFDSFERSQSRVVYFVDAPPSHLASILPRNGLIPTSIWVRDGVVWALFHSHREARAALSLSSPRFIVAPALEADLLEVLKPKPNATMSNPRVSAPTTPASGVPMACEEYTLSSNPPNARNTFRQGDWICRSQNCAAHNFGRNLTCIGCGSSRPTNGSPTMDMGHHHSFSHPPPSSRAPISPRFVSANSPTNYGFPPPSPRPQPSQPLPVNLPLSSTLAALNKAASSGYPILTPSGRAFAVGGKVQNVSSDPLTPCIMYWPDNEPFPEQGQIRPSSLMNVPQPPILNTGNRGPISHQPGDWICLKCNYLNWRRRKVCQTCLPYAEGNGDSISAAVQAERIALLTSVLAQTGIDSTPSSPSPPLVHQLPALPTGRSHSATPAHAHRSFVNVTPPRGVHRSQSHSELGSGSFPIYETSRYHGQPSPLHRPVMMSPPVQPLPAPAPAPLLPSFLQDIIQSPTLSPASTSSADLSFDEYEDNRSLSSSTRSTFSGGDSPLANIWRLDGEETKSIPGATFPLPLRRERGGALGLAGADSAASSRNSSLERLGRRRP
ncbi:RanBP2-type domain-containing protein [Mycena indigotica]|uniref:RanBP2-type domain-containing protein n=1 Tax=Mycena indigotica TaxID=2126181 RepID=A0A8H6VX76_9AGAR|nr:RanBP2-type domain-containing protein [Mycena indigotica]KAF7297182.1 RanBP2-type domain-containing protein [Mycena indigotica]